MIRIAIVEDDPAAQQQLKNYLEKYLNSRKERFVIVCFSDGKEIADDYKPDFDLIFLDIEMAQLDGMSAAKRIREADKHTLIVFVTQMAQYAVKGYEVDAVDFILKPLDYFSFAFKMQKVMDHLALRKELKMLIRNGSSWCAVPSGEIYYIEVLNHDLIFHTANGVYKMRGSLNEMEQKLAPVGFRRCNKSYLLNLAHIRSIEGNSILVGRDNVPLSRSMRKDVVCALADYYGGKV